MIPSVILQNDWAIQAEAHGSFMRRVASPTGPTASEIREQAGQADRVEEYCLEMGYIHRPRQVGDVMVVPLIGVLVHACTLVEEAIYGLANMEQISVWIADAAKNPDIRGIVLRVDSPGGTVMGTPDLARVVERAGRMKPLIAANCGMMCSAAYYAACSAGLIYTAHGALAGSIGVILQIMDLTGYFEQFGIRIETFASGPLKGTGAQGTSLSTQQREHVQGRVNLLADDFKGWVTRHRAGVPDDAMQGQSFYGAGGIANGLSDGFGTLGDAVRDVLTL